MASARYHTIISKSPVIALWNQRYPNTLKEVKGKWKLQTIKKSCSQNWDVKTYGKFNFRVKFKTNSRNSSTLNHLRFDTYVGCSMRFVFIIYFFFWKRTQITYRFILQQHTLVTSPIISMFPAWFTIWGRTRTVHVITSTLSSAISAMKAAVSAVKSLLAFCS